jgi:predicted O-methyltransferase YrrM
MDDRKSSMAHTHSIVYRHRQMTINLTSGPLHDIRQTIHKEDVLRIFTKYDLKWLPNDQGSVVTNPEQFDFYEWYFAYGRILQPKTILEIGVFGGASILFLCLGSGTSPSFIQLVDNQTYPHLLQNAVERIRKVADTAVIDALLFDSQRLPSLANSAGVQFDIVSIDGDHRIGPCYHDLHIAAPNLAADGHILCDDARHEDVSSAIDRYLSEHPELADLYVETLTGTRVLHRRDNGHLERCPLITR